jgi:hypothetical protein
MQIAFDCADPAAGVVWAVLTDPEGNEFCA